MHEFKIGDKVTIQKAPAIVAGFYENGIISEKPSDFLHLIAASDPFKPQAVVHHSLLVAGHPARKMGAVSV
jgi:hypothetical protein